MSEAVEDEIFGDNAAEWFKKNADVDDYDDDSAISKEMDEVYAHWLERHADANSPLWDFRRGG